MNSTRSLFFSLTVALLTVIVVLQSCSIDSITNTNNIQNDSIRILNQRLELIEQQQPFADR